MSDAQWPVKSGAAVTSINGDTTAAQVIAGTNPIQATTAAGTTTIAKLAASALTDGATPALDASLSWCFTLSAAGNRTIGIPTNATANQIIVILHTASGGSRTLAFNTGAGGFRFGTSIVAGDITATASGVTDRTAWQYNSTDSKWDILAYTKG